MEFPLPYPSACSPQAWATGAALMLVTAVLGLEIGADGLRTDPHLPADVHRLALYDVPTRFGPLSTA